jgi:monocyte-to-macrophage differentiation protein
MEFFNISLQRLAGVIPENKTTLQQHKQLQHKTSLLTLIKDIKWKNEPPKKHEAYEPTPIEHIANILTHGLWVFPIIWYSYCLIISAVTPKQYWAAWIYGCVLIGLFSVSTCFHVFASFGKSNWIRDILHRGDRAMIYLFIAGSYTPWLTLRVFAPNGWANQLSWAIWVFAILGIIYQQLFHEKYKWLETIIYLTVALTPSLAILEMSEDAEMNDDSGWAELRQGGAVYLLGVIFFKLDGRLPLAHAIWHLHVVIGAMIHYWAVAQYLFGPNSQDGKN